MHGSYQTNFRVGFFLSERERLERFYARLFTVAILTMSGIGRRRRRGGGEGSHTARADEHASHVVSACARFT